MARTYLSATADILAERNRQITEKGYDEDHDDCQEEGEIARAAAAYCLAAIFPPHALTIFRQALWPWEAKFWKPRSHRENLVRAGALIMAEIERLDRRGE